MHNINDNVSFAEAGRKEVPAMNVLSIRRSKQQRRNIASRVASDRASPRCSWLYLPVKTRIAPFFASVTQAPATLSSRKILSVEIALSTCYKSIIATSSRRSADFILLVSKLSQISRNPFCTRQDPLKLAAW